MRAVAEPGRAPLCRLLRPRPLPCAAGEVRFVAAVCAALTRAAKERGLALAAASAEEMLLYRQMDPVNGDESVVGEWLDDLGRRAGGFVRNPDGSFYAELAVAPGGAVESIRAWGVDLKDIHCEARVL